MHIKKKTELKVEKDGMEGGLTALEHEMEAAATVGGARVLQEPVESMEEGSYCSNSQIAPLAPQL